MPSQSQRNAGIALVVFTVLMVFTMVLHPAGGDVQYLLKVKTMIIVVHSIALASIPFGYMGFKGVTQRLGDGFFSSMAFAFVNFGLIAVLLAAATNGLVLPIFIERYRNASPELIESVKPIIRYSFSVNNAFDYVYTGAFIIAMLSWSIAILMTKRLAAWIGWAGIVFCVIAFGIAVSGVSMGGVLGFRMFVASVIGWILVAGVALIRVRDK